MKNIHLLPTDKPSRLCYVICTEKSTLTLFEDEMEKGKRFFPQNIYITSDEEIKEGDWFLPKGHINPHKLKGFNKINGDLESYNGLCYDISKCKKIILTTDQDLIKDGVQAIDDEEWFVKNPSCERVEVERSCLEVRICDCAMNENCLKPGYKIIIPKEEPKQETLEEANWKVLGTQDDTFYKGAKWQADRMYSEDKVIILLNKFGGKVYGDYTRNQTMEDFTEEWFEQYKKKQHGV